MAKRARAGSARQRGRGKKKGGFVEFVRRTGSLIGAAVLIGAGFLFGSFWVEWRGAEATVEPTLDPGDLPLAERIKVEVLNGAGVPGLAQRIADRLLARGFDVVAIDNADHFDHAMTHVIDRSGRQEAASEVARRLGVDSLAAAIDPDLSLDATVIVGLDWSGPQRGGRD